MNKLSDWQEISPFETENSLKLIGKDWMLITVRDGDKVNAMTASWGCMGVLWNKPVAVCFIRPQRHTFGLAEAEERFSLCFMEDEYRNALGVCGKLSGRDLDKLKEAGLSSENIDGVPVISEAKMILVCKKLYSDFLKEDAFIDKSLLSNYTAGDYHKMYVLEIEKVFVK